ncbi:hypothetical protein FACS189444_4920 [Spirochaetia bacterium]|nr:hypothetical protein FACS189444_4920 [Spirochaetia bacterium]
MLTAILGFASCTSSPAPIAVDEDVFPLDPGGSVYLTIDVTRARPLLDLLSFGGMTGKDAAQMLDMTWSAVAAVYPEGGERSYLVSAAGKYPAASAGMSFTFSPAWKKVRSPTGLRYWRSAKDNLSVLLEGNRARVSDGDPIAGTPGVTAPAALADIRRGAVLAGWLDDVETPINRFMEFLGLPLQIPADQVIFGVYESPVEDEAAEQRYEAALRIETPSVSQAIALRSMIAMVRLFMAGAADLNSSPAALGAVLFANPPVQDDTALILHTGSMDSRSIALLFNLFSVYSKKTEE